MRAFVETMQRRLITFLSSFFCTSFIVIICESRIIPPQSFLDEPEQNNEWMIIPDMKNQLHIINLKQKTLPNVEVNETDIIFYYFSRNTKSFELKIDSIDRISETDFNPNRKTMFIIHGWTSNGQSEMNELITSALLETDDWNVFNIDWNKLASKDYISAKVSLKGCAAIIAKFLKYLKDNKNLNLNRVYLTGHSLGGQMTGRIGAHFKGEIGFIIGLDPALPMFKYDDLEDRLDPSDAMNVQIIHTNGGRLGYLLPLGHSDFFPNGGQIQKGCESDLFGICSHIKAYYFFEESIRSNKFISFACENYETFLQGNCYENRFSFMGGNEPDIRAFGPYYLDIDENLPPTKS